MSIDQPQQARDGRDETPDEQLDRNTIELLNELRVAGTGIQIMVAFLLVVPFNAGWSKTTSFERTEYLVTLALVTLAALLLMAPPIQHRLLFRHHEKRYLITVGNQLAILGMVFLARLHGNPRASVRVHDRGHRAHPRRRAHTGDHRRAVVRAAVSAARPRTLTAASVA